MIIKCNFFDMLLYLFGFKDDTPITIECDKRQSQAYNYDTASIGKSTNIFNSNNPEPDKMRAFHFANQCATYANANTQIVLHCTRLANARQRLRNIINIFEYARRTNFALGIGHRPAYDPVKNLEEGLLAPRRRFPSEISTCWRQDLLEQGLQTSWRPHQCDPPRCARSCLERQRCERKRA